MNLVKAMVVGWHPGSDELLQRRVGGILKGLAKVQACTIDRINEHTDAQLLVTYANSHRLQEILVRKFKKKVKIVGVELTLLPPGIKAVRLIDPSVRLGVVAGHRRCANYFFSELVRAGVMDHTFSIGTFEDMPYMPVDQFVISEEMVSLIKDPIDPKRIITVPRSISPASAADLIHAALEVASSN